MARWWGLAAGSLAGGFARYFVATWVYAFAGASFPYGTLVVNLSGCFLIGLFDSLAEARFLLGPDARLLLMTGFCGAYTTFSTLILETSNLFRDGQWGRGLANFLGSGGLGLALFWAGYSLGTVV